MAPNQSQRPQFYEGQYLGAEDLQALTEYDRSMDARHVLGAHTWGIASGLQLVEKDIAGGVDVYLTPGYAWDGFGRPIVVLAPYKIPSELFKPIGYDATLDGSKGRQVKVWLRYDEIVTRPPAPGFERCEGDAFSRVQETFRVEIGERTPSQRQTNLSAGGIASPAQDIHAKLGMSPTVLYDESVPFQAFPSEGDPARSLIPIGSVRWKPNANPLLPGAFVKRAPEDLINSRRVRWAIGVVAETIRPVEDVVRIRGRGQDPAPKRWSSDIAWVEGDLRIDGKLNLCDPTWGNLKWQVDGTTSDLLIGEANATGTDSRVTIKALGNVGIGTTQPKAKLDVADLVRFGLDEGGSGPKVITFTRDLLDEVNAGKIAYKPKWDNGALAIVGAGKPPHRRIHMWEDVIIEGNVGIGTTDPKLKLDVQGDLGRSNDASTLHLFGSRIGDVGEGVLFLRSGGSVVTFDGNDRVGVGLNNPDSRLHVVNTINGDERSLSSHVATIENRSSENDADVLALKVGNSSPVAGNNFITFFGGNQIVGRIERTGTTIQIQSGGADFAECLPSVEEGEEIEAADIVGVYGGKITKRTQDADHILAVSSQPLIVGCAQPREREHLYRTVAFLGQVPVKVRGLVNEGDYVVPSGLNDGIGRAIQPAELHSCDRGTIVGRAWESSQDPGVKLIKTAVGLSSTDSNHFALSCFQRQQHEIQEMREELALLKSCVRQEGDHFHERPDGTTRI